MTGKHFFTKQTKRERYKYTQSGEMNHVQTERVAGDGDCLFASILRDARVGGRVQDLRDKVSEYVRDQRKNIFFLYQKP
jgi:hypothetical protein